MAEEKNYLDEFQKIMDGCKSWDELRDKILGFPKGDERYELLGIYYDNYVSQFISNGSFTYDPESFGKDNREIVYPKIIKDYLDLIPQLRETEYQHRAIAAFLSGDKQACWGYLRKNVKSIKSEKDKYLKAFTERDFMDFFNGPFVNRLPGLYKFLAKEMKGFWCNEAVEAMPSLMDRYYQLENPDDRVHLLEDYLLKYPETNVPRFFLSNEYFYRKLWDNAIAAYENIDMEQISWGASAYIEFNMAEAYYKLRDYKNNEKHYRLCLSYDTSYPSARNNLGYALIRQKKYEEAYQIFKDLVDYKEDLPYSANNFIRCLIALGRNKDAHDFVNSGEFKIPKFFRDKVQNLDHKNKRLSKKAKEPPTNPAAGLDDMEDDDSSAIMETGRNKAPKGTSAQFTREDNLENELEAQIKRNIPVFGRKLKMYRRKGIYGRQYPITSGYIDLLCEDDEGNVYVIELKKDSGYDDPYEQTAAYLEWFEKNDFAHGKKIYGIICLNNPTKKLIEKVRKDKRMKLFEYQISYTEIK